jgi:tetratricopeptide (TPR) repeat protein
MEQISGFGAQRFPLDPQSPPKERQERTRIMLARALNLRTVVALVGSGCSAPLGYPTWNTLVADVIREALKKKPAEDSLSRLRGAVGRVTSGRVTPRDLTFYLGLCQTALNKGSSNDPFHKAIADRIKRQAARAKREGNHNPYLALMDLPIDRYVTSNYDHELETAITLRKGIEEPLWFTQDNHGKLAGFAVAGLPELRNAVFHCHGSFNDAHSIVASESDYQHWYLTQRNTAATTFRQSLRLLFGSNPILFLGFSMDDDDLLQTLRVFSADDPELKASRPLFALTEYAGTRRERERIVFLYERYGINVLTYPRPKRKSVAARGRALSLEIGRLGEIWRKHSDGWALKPAIRRVQVPVHPDKPYQHYSIEMHDTEVLAPKRTAQEINKLYDHVQDLRTRVLVITGDGGSGKSWRVLNLLERLKKERGNLAKGGVFFWSSYYADDWLTGLDRALSYFNANAEPRSRRLDRFRDSLCSGPHLLVFDGFERLLRQVGASKVGLPYSKSVERLLEIMKKDSQSTVILTTRLVPETFVKLIRDDDDGTGPVRQFAIRHLTTEDLMESALFKHASLTEDDLSMICSLCGGHSYAILLAAKYLTSGHDQVRDRLNKFRREISRRAPDSRNAEIIKMAIEAVDLRTDGMASKLLERLAIFMSPIHAQTLAICLEAASIDSKRKQRRVVQELLRAKLLLRVSTDPPQRRSRTDGWPGRVTVHPTVRSLVFYQSHGITTDALPNFTLAGFTSGNAPCYPGNGVGKEQITTLFDTLCTRAADLGRPKAIRRSMCRAAFGVMRSRMESNTVPRWTNYDDYVRLGLRLLYVAKGIAGKEVWHYRERTHSTTKHRLKGVLYADELAWLYNDIGLALCSEGYMADAYSLWEQGFEIDSVTDSEEEGGQYLVQSHLHMAHLFLELGRLRRAGQFLTTTERANELYGDEDFRGRILGYRGLLAHLAGNLDEAEKLYKRAVRVLTSRGRRNLRAASMFHRHWADLMMAKHDLVAAEEEVETALSLAREGEFPDLEAYARKSRAHVWRDKKQDLVAARAEYNTAMASAQRFGIRRLQADIHSELARLALDVGDWETARVQAMESLMLANELSLGIRRTHGLVILGLTMEAAGNSALAISYLQHAWALAMKQGYHLRGREAEQHLQRLGASTPVFRGSHLHP